MKRFLLFLLFALLVTLPASAQLNYDGALWGDKISLIAPVDVQCELDYYTAPWGSVLEGDPPVVFFGTLSQPEPDLLVLDIKWTGNDSGYAPGDAGAGLKNMKFYWDDAVGSYISIVNDGSTRLRFQAITISLNTGIWRVGILQWDPAGYPWWVLGTDFLQEWSVKEQTLEPWRWSSGTRIKPSKRIGKE